MLILRSRTLILRMRDLQGKALPFLLNDASEAGRGRLAVILIT